MDTNEILDLACNFIKVIFLESLVWFTIAEIMLPLYFMRMLNTQCNKLRRMLELFIVNPAFIACSVSYLYGFLGVLFVT